MTPKERPESGSQLAVVNGLRGVAILAVLFHHLVAPFVAPFAKGSFVRVGPVPVFRESPLYNGWLGVNLFFVLSGFVLALPYADGRREFDGVRDAKTFFVRRAKRLLPLYYLCVLVSLVASLHVALDGPPFRRDVLSLLTFAFAFDAHRFLPQLNPALWSIGVEVWFSLCFPLLVLAKKKLGGPAFLGLCLSLALGVRLWAVFIHHGPPVYQSGEKDNVFGRLDDFAAGMTIASLYVRGKIPRGAASVGLLVSGAAVVLASGVGWDSVVLGAVPYSTCAFLNDVTLIGCVAVVLGALGAPPILRSLLASRPLSVLGMMCYSLYLWHFVGVERLRSGQLGATDVPTYLALVFAVSALTYRFVEFPERSVRALFVDTPR